MIRGVLDSEIAGMEKRHAANENCYRQAGGFAPTIGILGTVLSLVFVLENLSDPSSLGHSIAGAFIATLYGVGSANVFYFPIANRLKELSGDEVHYREMVMDAILAIQAGENPRLLGERLETYLPPAERGAAAEQAPASEPAPVEDEMAEAA
jgi:chemotaxis protein MotA